MPLSPYISAVSREIVGNNRGFYQVWQTPANPVKYSNGAKLRSNSAYRFEDFLFVLISGYYDPCVHFQVDLLLKGNHVPLVLLTPCYNTGQ